MKRNVKSYKTIVLDALFSMESAERLALFRELTLMICPRCGDAIHPKLNHICTVKNKE